VSTAYACPARVVHAARTVLLALRIVAMLAVLIPAAHAIDTEEPLGDPQLQVRYERLINELRCLVCQNETIADSNAGLAADLRREVRALVLEGKSDDEIRGFMTDRYGDFVLYRPPFTPRTALLWALPVLLLLAGAVVALRVVKQRSQLVSIDPDEPEPAERT
jgi:cytochrome c-type biogenesis protein CcmH